MLRYFSISELCVLLVTELQTGDTLGLRFLLKHTDASFGVRKKSTPPSPLRFPQLPRGTHRKRQPDNCSYDGFRQPFPWMQVPAEVMPETCDIIH